MPRRNNKNRKRQHLAGKLKPGGKQRPRAWHHGPLRDEHFAEAERLFRQAEEEAA